MNKKEIEEIERIIDYRFSDRSLLVQAFTHSSYANKNPNTKDNEVLEFFGDAIIGLYVTKLLMENPEENSAGSLTEKRKNIVKNENLTKHSKRLGLANYLKIGNGQIISDKMKADLIEALIGAIAKDGERPMNGQIDLEGLLFVKIMDILDLHHLDKSNCYCPSLKRSYMDSRMLSDN